MPNGANKCSGGHQRGLKIGSPSHNLQRKIKAECLVNIIYHLQHFRSESFDDANLSHETQLLELWTLLQPDRPLLKRVTKQWQDIGRFCAL